MANCGSTGQRSPYLVPIPIDPPPQAPAEPRGDERSCRSVPRATIIPLAIYLNEKNIIKVKIALASGKTQCDKREALKERESKREMDRVRKGDRE